MSCFFVQVDHDTVAITSASPRYAVILLPSEAAAELSNGFFWLKVSQYSINFGSHCFKCAYSMMSSICNARALQCGGHARGQCLSQQLHAASRRHKHVYIILSCPPLTLHVVFPRHASAFYSRPGLECIAAAAVYNNQPPFLLMLLCSIPGPAAVPRHLYVCCAISKSEIADDAASWHKEMRAYRSHVPLLKKHETVVLIPQENGQRSPRTSQSRRVKRKKSV